LGFTSLENCCDPLYLWVIMLSREEKVVSPFDNSGRRFSASTDRAF
jgi:hypothetical protein